MKALPAISAKQVIKTLKVNPTTKRITVIPVHPGKTIKKPLLKAIIEDDAGITAEEFLQEL